MRTILLAAVVVVASGCAASPSAITSTSPEPAVTLAALTITGGVATSANEVLLNMRAGDSAGHGAAGQTIFLASTAGTFNYPSVLTGPTGAAQAILTTTRDATVIASAGNLVATATATAFRVPEPPRDVPPIFPPAPPVVPPAPIVVVPPTLAGTLTCTPVVHATATPCNVTATYGGNAVPGAAITAVAWDWADGTVVATTTAPINTHTYAQAGTYTAVVTVTATTADGVKTTTTSKALLIP